MFFGRLLFGGCFGAIYNRILPVVTKFLVASGGATSTGGGLGEFNGHLPFTEGNDMAYNSRLPGCMGVVAHAASPSLVLIYVQKVKIVIAVSEVCVFGCLFTLDYGAVVALPAQAIFCFGLHL